MCSRRKTEKGSARVWPVVLVLAAFAWGLSPPGATAQPQHLRFEPVGDAQIPGTLPLFRAILQDRAGFLWFGTEAGLFRYDGYTLKPFLHDPDDPYSIPGNVVFDLAEDPDGTLWIAANESGLISYDPVRGRFRRHTPPDGVSLPVQRVAADGQGRLWLGHTTHGLFQLDRATDAFVPVPLPSTGPATAPALNDLYVDRRGRLWICTQEQGLFYLDGPSDTFTPFPLPEKLDAAKVQTEDDQGRLQIATASNIYRLDPTTEYVTPLLTPQHRATLRRLGTTGHRYVDRRGLLWFTVSNQHGVYTLDLATNHLSHYTHRTDDPFSMPDDFVHRIFEDRSGVLWFGTYAGLRKLVPQWTHFEIRTLPDGDPGPLLALTETRSGDLLATSFCGFLYRFTERSRRFVRLAETYPALRSIEPECVMTIYEDTAGMLWLGGWHRPTSEGGLYRLNPQTGTLTHYLPEPDDPYSLASTSMRVIYEDQPGSFWIGTEDGLTHLDDAAGHFTTYRHDPHDPHTLGSNAIWALYEDAAGRFWVGTYGGGLNLFDRRTGHVTRYVHDPHDPSTLSSNTVSVIHQVPADSGALWIGTYDGGLNRFDPARGIFTRFTERHGLPSHYVKAILEDAHGGLWLSTDNGLARFDRASHAVQLFSEADGLPRDFGLHDACKRRNGTFAFGASTLIQFHPDRLGARTYEPPLVLTSFHVFDQETALPRGSDVLRLPWRDNFFSFEFAALDFAAPDRIQYAYRLDGFDDDWIESGSRRFASFTNLDPGPYTFRVRATNSNGVWSEQELSIPLFIVPPFWMTLWFRLLVAGVAIALVAGLARYVSTRNLRRQVRTLELQQQLQTERERISRDLHDHVGAQLSGMISTTELIRLSREADAPERVNDYLSMLEDDARLTMAQLRETIWALDGKAITAADFLARVEHYAHRLLRQRPGPHLHVALEGDADRLFTPVQALNLYRIAQESINNVLKHARARTLWVSLYAPPTGPFVLEIRDDGHFAASGFQDEALNGYGLRNMRQRTQELGGDFSITQDHEAGTRVRVSIPV